MDREQIRDFLTTRRARLGPEDVGLPTGGRRRVPGLRREEVAVIAGVSTEWYTRLEKGHIAGVSEDVLAAVAGALRLDDDERRYLFDLARSSRAARRTPSRRKDVAVPPRVQWVLDSMTGSSAFVRNGRMDVVAENALARALHSPMYDSPTVGAGSVPNLARFIYLDPASQDFFPEWEAAGTATAALLRAEAGREPHDRALQDLVGELSTLSPEFRTAWASHDVRIRHDGTKLLRHPDVGDLELTYLSFDMPLGANAFHDLTVYAAEPGTPSDERLHLLASLHASRPEVAEPAQD